MEKYIYTKDKIILLRNVNYVQVENSDIIFYFSSGQQLVVNFNLPQEASNSMKLLKDLMDGK